LSDHDIKNMKRNPETGLVKVWDIHANGGRGAWKDVNYVDAVEMLKVGSAHLDGPENEEVTEQGRVNVTKPDADTSPAKGEGKEPAKSDGGDEDPDPYVFTAHSTADLRTFAAKAGLDLPDNLSRAKLIEALDKSGFRPDAKKGT
jgi:hypothetical protein